jgi:8-oxo-dGTP pyrophosphatase MutT (NUDIX family)
MKDSYEVTFQIEKPFGNLYRKETVLILLIDKNGRFVLGNKPNYFPTGITRMLGGGVDQGEMPQDAAVREIAEEVGIDIQRESLGHLATISIDAKAKDGREFKTRIHVFSYVVQTDELKAGDDVADFKYLDEAGFRELIENFNSLPMSLLQNKDGEDFSWGDYGKVYGFVHKVALDQYLASKK